MTPDELAEFGAHIQQRVTEMKIFRDIVSEFQVRGRAILFLDALRGRTRSATATRQIY
jgi:hypothetical protein